MKAYTITSETKLSSGNPILHQVHLSLTVNFEGFQMPVLHFQNFITLLFFIAAQPISCSVSCSCYYKFEQMASILNCSNSEMTSLSDLLVPNETSWLIAKDSNIKHLQWSDESRRNLNQMEYINLANSSISSIDPNFFSKLATLENIRYINLANNKLKGFNRDLLHVQCRLHEMFLSGNPISCNCGMFWLVELLNATIYPSGPRIVRDYESIRCFWWRMGWSAGLQTYPGRNGLFPHCFRAVSKWSFFNFFCIF